MRNLDDDEQGDARVNQDQLDHLFVHAAFLDERLRGTVGLEPDDQNYDYLVDTWSRAAAGGDADAFAERLGYLGVDSDDQLREILGTPAAINAELPTWLRYFADSQDLGAAPRTACGSEPAAGIDIVVGRLVTAAADRLAGDIQEFLLPAAAESLVNGLRRSLISIVANAVLHDLDEIVSTSPSESRASCWTRLQEQYRATGCADFWLRFPVAARLSAQACLDWVDRANEFLDRWQSDHVAVCELAGIAPTSKIDNVTVGISDPHFEHAQVIILTLRHSDDKVRVVYKPRSLAIDRIFNVALAWLAGNGVASARALSVIDRGNYGWVEFAEHRPAESVDKAQEYFFRSGALLALLHLLGAIDCHMENVVAMGDAPALIDVETVMSAPSRANWHPDSHGPDGSMAVGFSVLDAGLLPSLTDASGHSVDMTGLGSPGRPAPATDLEWVDRVGVGPVYTARTADNAHTPNTLVIAGTNASERVASPVEYGRELCDGFVAAWDLIASQGAELLQVLVAAGIRSVKIRAIVRATQGYDEVRRACMSPFALSSGLLFSITADHLMRYFLARDDSAVTYPLAEAERAQLEHGDVPYFSITADQGELCSAGRAVPWFRCSAFEGMHQRLKAFTPRHRKLQVALIQSSLGLAAQETVPSPRSSRTEGDRETSSTSPDQAALQMCNRICDQALVSESGSIWFGYSNLSDGSLVVGKSSVLALYSGSFGTSLALLAAGRTFGHERARAIGLLGVASAAELARSRAREIVADFGLAGGDGVGGLLYGLALSARLAPEYQSITSVAADRLVHEVSARSITSCPSPDVLDGLAGLILGLCAVNEQFGTDVRSPLSQVVAQLLMTHSHGEYPVWSGILADGSKGHQSGFAHGTAGIVFALMQAIPLVDPELAVAAEEICAQAIVGLCREWNPRLAAWPDLRDSSGQMHSQGWCTGSPGILLALSTAIDQGICAHRTDEVALAMSRAVDSCLMGSGFDLLCCGTAGAVEGIRFASSLGLADQMIAADLVSDLASRAASDQLAFKHPALPVGDASLFRGMAGVLWALTADSSPELGSPVAFKL